MISRATSLLLVALLITHFTIICLSVGPLNPLQLRLSSTINNYVSPYFAQNWMLFAPDPISDERIVLSRLRCKNKYITNYYDITTPNIISQQSDRIFPSRKSRIPSNAMLLAQGEDPVAQKLRSTSEKSDLPLTKEEIKQRNIALDLLIRYSTNEIGYKCNSHGGISETQIRFVVNKFPPWSQRRSKEKVGEVKNYDQPWRAPT